MKRKTLNEASRAAARPTSQSGADTIQGFTRKHPALVAMSCTDETRAHAGTPEFTHDAVNHNAREYVCEVAHTNGVREFFCAMAQSGYSEIPFMFSEKRLNLYVGDFSGDHNVRDRRVPDQMGIFVCRTVGRRLRYRDLVSANSLSSGAGGAA